MALDTLIVLGVLLFIALIHPGIEAKLHRVELAFRLWRNGYPVRKAWKLAEPHP